MTTHLHVKKDHLDGKNEQILHSIPCKICGDESANVSKYFTPFIRAIDDTHFDASFRGYPLHGKRIRVPKDYKGITFYEESKPEEPDAVRNLKSTGTFSEFVYWNYDKLPSENDPFVGAIEWIDIAEALHSPIEDSQDE